MANVTLITGGDGYLGRRIAAKLLEETDSRLLLWLRAADASAFLSKQDVLAESFGRFEGRVEYCYGDLTGESPFDGIEPASICRIVHAAAVTRFNVDEGTARRVNIEGTEKLLRFAERCGALERLGLLSSIYASGMRAGPIPETPFVNAGFANHYESSKWAAETLLFEKYAHLPWRIFRIATAIADDANGQVSQHNAVHNTLKLLYYGLISTLPGKPGTPMYLVTGDFAADAVCRLMRVSGSERIFHVAHRREQSLSLDELITLVFEVFGADEFFRKRRIPRPLYVDEEAFELLHSALGAFAGGVVNQAVDSVAPFARQLFITKEVQNANLIAALGRDPAPDASAVVEATCRHLVRTKWGREKDRVS